MPGGRIPIKNCVVGTKYRPTAYKFMKDEVEKGHQCYVICPMIEEGELDGAENVMDYASNLRHALPGLKIDILQSPSNSLFQYNYFINCLHSISQHKEK
jgi:ATP-dependent DNA helicase RecG